ncbi:hypothetical protein [Streptomyces sp. NPDC050564]|uniref:hypothetical protein n=1 Tax=Streptomyces sp. NPDC050564 TaxID=3365631 RepID=UPI0037AEB568
MKPRTKITCSAGSPAAALAMVFKLVESAQERRRAITGAHLVALVRSGARFENGALAEPTEEVNRPDRRRRRAPHLLAPRPPADLRHRRIMNGLPPHIAQLICEHRRIDTTMGHKAVHPAETIEAHRAFIARRRATRPSEEYRTPTEEEWDAFLAHFESSEKSKDDRSAWSQQKRRSPSSMPARSAGHR